MILKYYQKIDDAISYLFSSVCDEKKLIKSIFGKKKIVYVDIGTNEGSFFEYLLKFCTFKKVFCYEPILRLSSELKEKYSSKNIKIFNLALSNKKSSKKFFEYKISSQSSLYKQNDVFKSLKDLKKISKIKTEIFDNEFNDYRKIDFCKIDVQGEEINVLKGMKKNLKKKNIKLLKIEITFTERYVGVKSNFNEIISFLIKYDYHLISISKIKFKNNRLLLMDAYFLLK
ncbi:FkbM family methyltransferase [Pelagibacterales bacterium SAG-MED38]|nr:FkbM family methyltransferase [Pelagibacterales bacterium SAG-MED38]